MSPSCPKRSELHERATNAFHEYEELLQQAKLLTGADQISEYCSVRRKAGQAFRLAMEAWNQYFEHTGEHGCAPELVRTPKTP